jgi:hypothetical protein
MKLRLSNGISFAVEFNAGNEIQFRKNIRHAALQYFAHEGKKSSAQLHIATDSGEWVSANYPKSNANFYIRFGQTDLADWKMAKQSNSSGTWFEFELDCMNRFFGKEQ